jgi:hypothetical protein
MRRWLPGLVLTIFVGSVAMVALRPISSAGGFDLNGFGRLPVSLSGRVQPIDSAARLALLQIRGTAMVSEGDVPFWQVWRRTTGVSATEWLLETLTKPDTADTRKIFRLSEPSVRAVALGAEPAAPAAIHYAFKDLQPHVKEITERVAIAAKVKPFDRTPVDREWLALRDALVVYERLKNSLQPNSFLQEQAAGKPVDYDLGAQLASYEADMRAAITARREGKSEGLDKTTEERVVSFVRPYIGVSQAALLSLLPPIAPERGRDRWLNVGAALVGSSRTGTYPASLSYFARMGTAYSKGNAAEFNEQLGGYEQWLTARGLTPEVRRTGTEFFYNRLQPFARAGAIYLIVLLLAGVSVIGRSTVLYRCSVSLLALAVTMHVTGIMFDMMLQGTLPITNLYSALLAAGIVAVVFSAALERKYRNGIALHAAAILGLAAVIAASGMAPGGVMALAAEALNPAFLLAAVAALLTLWLVLRPLKVSLRWARSAFEPSVRRRKHIMLQ